MDNASVAQQAKIGTRSLSKLKSFPLQQVYFADLNDEELTLLAEDIQRRELQRPIQILPKNRAGFPIDTIIDGHQRRRALLSLGRDEVQVRVRYDLANASREEIEREFLAENLARRQLSKLGQARAVDRIYKIECGQKTKDGARARDRVGKLIGISGRHLNRLWDILKTPTEVQAAYEGNLLPLLTAAKVASLHNDVQKQIASRIKKGEAPGQVVSEFLSQLARSRKKTKERLKAAMQAVSNVKLLRGLVASSPSTINATHVSKIKSAIDDLQFVMSAVAKRSSPK